MYPFARLALVSRLAKRRPSLPIDGVSHLRLTCWPFDIDMFAEMNNGRVLTLYDLGRFDHGHRIGLIALLKPKGWGLAVGGASVRYRRRVRVFDRLSLSTQTAGLDERWFYIQQVMRVGDTVASAGLMRVCCTSKAGIVPTAEVLAALGAPGYTMPPPGWVQAWIDAEAQRPWPPEMALPGEE